ncbi:MAG: gliding motility-associated C-terminal domain-containing protein [Flavobacteriales bacterium]
MGRTLALALLLGTQLSMEAQVTADVAWQRCIGGSAGEFGSDLCATSDGGFIAIGTTASADGDATGTHGNVDMLVTKLNADGDVLWRRVLGGSQPEATGTCMEASDGSIMVAGMTQSNDGDVSGNHGLSDLWVVKLSPLGAIIWQHAYGGSSLEGGGQILETADGGFVVYGVTNSDDGDVVGFHPPGNVQDTWVLKIGPSGMLEWSRTLGGSGTDSVIELIQTADGGFLVNFAYTTSNDGDVTGNHGGQDCWLVKLGPLGAIEWATAIGGSQKEFGYDVLELDNGDILLLGGTFSNDGNVAGLNHGGFDVFLSKISSSGQVIWTRTYGGSLNDDCRSLLATADGGFIIGGSSGSSDGDVTINRGGQDVWVFKVDANGTLLWQRSYGGSLEDWAFLYEDDRGGYVLSGYTYSTDGDMQDSNGGRDLWLARLTDNGDLVWHRCLGGSAEDWGYLKAQTPDTGYVAFGYTDSNDGDVSGNHGGRDMWAVKVKVTGTPERIACALFIPTAFSPDNSTKNDAYCLYGTDCIATMQLGIYDRWGNKVFESTDPQACWDGTYNGQPLDPAVFAYHLSATLSNGERVERQGNITLMR